ncbi:hypothetical protein [Tianweitania sediminis]|uniref:Uncharacterized protein n=1 Tax=Tianweitania sediminis TaxID=1502156 RepID=A0A8J7ULF2_9HYPH|nr:hypothetical protein [Tianweitania sediminis]MBP0440669.1 hypothetical protein [Tianweitania sediminis]
MKQDTFDRLEAIAAARGAEAMGQRLEELGKAQVFEGMEWEEWLDAVRSGIAGYRQCLKAEISGEAPF